MNSQKFCLKWDHFRTSVTSVFNHLRRDGELVDITLCCEGQRVKAHRMMLSACSPYFRELLKENPCQHPVFFLKDTSAEDLRAVIEFVYNGEVNVSQGQLASFIKTAEMLQIRGLSGEDDEGTASVPGVASGGGSVGERPAAERRQPPERVRSPPAKRRRRSGSPPETPGRPIASPAVSTPASATGGGAAAAPVLPRPPTQQQQQQHQPEEITLAEHSPVNVKVEADLAKTEDDPSLEAALGRVVYEGADAELSSLTADDSLGEAGPSGALGSDRGLQGSQGLLGLRVLEEELVLDVDEPPLVDPLGELAAQLQPDFGFCPLNLAWLDSLTREKLLRHLPFQQSDWRRLVTAIFDNVQLERTHTSRRWYSHMAFNLMDRFPHLFASMTTGEAVTFIKKKLRTKAKNTRYRYSHPRLILPESPPLTGRSPMRPVAAESPPLAPERLSPTGRSHLHPVMPDSPPMP